MKSVLVSTRRENLTISPVTTPYLDRMLSVASCTITPDKVWSEKGLGRPLLSWFALSLGGD